MTMTLEHAVMDLVDDTSFMFPAGDWADIRAHLPVLYTLARWCTCAPFGEPMPQRGPRCLEIGVRQGVSTVAILSALRRVYGRLVSLDIDPVETDRARAVIEQAGLAPWWEFHLIHSDEFIRTWTLGELDFLWIDGDHQAPQPMRDFTNYEPLVRVGGMIAMHDYYVEPWRSDAGGVAHAVEAARVSGRFEVLTLSYSYGLTLLRKLSAEDAR